MRKSKLQKFSENKSFSCLIEPNYTEVYGKDYKLKGKWANQFFKNSNPIILELGCGKGEYTIGLAQKFIEKNFMGIDIKGSRLWTCSKFVSENKIKNAGFIRCKIDFIDSLFDSEIDSIWVTFPDPFLDKPNRRLISPVFLNKYLKILKPNSQINIKTDNNVIYEFAKEIAKENQYEVVHDFPDLHSESKISEILQIKTTYETKFMKIGKPIKYFAFILSHQAKLLKRKQPNSSNNQAKG